MLLIHHEEQTWAAMPESERAGWYAEYGKFGEFLKQGNHYVSGSQLQPSSTATTVRVRDGKRLVTDGPFAETREQLGGYYIVEAKDLDEALAIAARVPAARYGTIEVRPMVMAAQPTSA
jgi:hypothetical protein